MKNIKNVDIATIRRFPAMDFIGNDFAIFDNIGDIPLFGYPTQSECVLPDTLPEMAARIRINLKSMTNRRCPGGHTARADIAASRALG